MFNKSELEEIVSEQEKEIIELTNEIIKLHNQRTSLVIFSLFLISFVLHQILLS